ncbi:MAG: hypothetical protein Q7J16_08820 [Candidatus Cloacimonadales bacterium]|nr:hypothetical protein [Candidatus Cloacimonadales bacterium]
MSDNAGADLLKILVKIMIWILKLLPGLIKLIIKGIVAIIKMFKKKGNAAEPPAE